ncbi:trichoplein keratin filament-binding protein isoform X1 [Lathamus discolor]|uniref:trichoplein keratin filament-binding protein isoform X1 n=1 Tax=Lathamus discolor TaxID=678569 RepID=UPI0032B763BE
MALWGRGPAVQRWAAGREREARSRQQWERTRRSFAQAAVCCSLQARWSEPRGPPRRAGPGAGGGRAGAGSAAAERLEQRRARLRRLLAEEREALAAELRRGRGAERPGKVSGARPPLAPALGGSGTLRWHYAIQLSCSQGAEQLLFEHWKKKNAELREVESDLNKKHVTEAWGDQVQQKSKREATELEEKKRYENKYETARREALERMRQEEEKRRQEEKKQAEMLLQQIEELKLQEREATKLKKEQENLLKQQWELESLEEGRKQMEEHRKKRELGRFLRHQCNAQLQRRAQQIQEELEIDRQILSALLEKEDEEQRRQSARRERAVADAAWMKHVIEEQLQLEKEREAELQTIFREEARKMWEKREEEWQREKAARDRLMNEVLAGRQRQIQEKMELNRRAQEESIRYREQLIKELEEAKELTRREKEQEEELKRARRQELEAQLTEQRLEEQEEQQHRREEEEEERSAQQHCQELVQQEAKRMVEQGYPPKLYSYPKPAWT